MKKPFRFAALCIAFTFAITSCSAPSSNKSAARVADVDAAGMYSDEVLGTNSPQAMYEGAGLSKYESGEPMAEPELVANPAQPQSLDRKLIKNVNMGVETKNFDEYLKSIQLKAAEFEGYVSNLSVYDKSYYNGSTYGSSNRGSTADIEIRIPTASLDSFLALVEEGVNVKYQTLNTTDVTLQYSDMEAHIKSLTTEQDRLMELIAKAESVDAIIVIESRLSEVRYQLESYHSQLRLMDNQVQYSTISLSVVDVKEYQTTDETSYFERIRIGFMDNLGQLGAFISSLFLALVTSLPTLIFLILALALLIFLIRKLLKAFRNNKSKTESRARTPLFSGIQKKQSRADKSSLASVKSDISPKPAEDSKNQSTNNRQATDTIGSSSSDQASDDKPASFKAGDSHTSNGSLGKHNVSHAHTIPDSHTHDGIGTSVIDLDEDDDEEIIEEIMDVPPTHTASNNHTHDGIGTTVIDLDEDDDEEIIIG